MKRCRILSIVIIAISIISVVISIIMIANKNKDKPVYATSINFVGNLKGAEILIDNDLVLDTRLIKIEPSNCSFKPEFTIRKSGDTSEKNITTSTYKFTEEGRYVLNCKIKAGKNYYIDDKITITTVNIPSETTSMYIIPNTTKVMYVDEVLKFDKFVKISAPTNAKLDITYTNHITMVDNNIIALNDGMAIVNLTLTYDNLSITKSFDIIVRPKTHESSIGLELTIGINAITDYVVNISNSNMNIILGYTLTNTDNQLINCWTESNIIEIEKYTPDGIVINPKSSGTAIMYISPEDYPSRVFEITINIA